MKALIQRVSRASVSVNNERVSSIGSGLLVFLGIGRDDKETSIAKLAQKIAALRIFDDEDGKLNKTVSDCRGEILLVSQFTLYADCSKGNRPSFIAAAPPEKAEEYYELCAAALRAAGLTVKTGRFRTHMDIELLNDGPTTIMLEMD